MVLLLTACVCPDPGVYSLQLTNPSLRLDQYKRAVRFYLDIDCIAKIVFCDNSNYIGNYDDLIAYANQKGKTLEVLCFSGDFETAVRKGKGFGEGEISNYALHNSKLMHNDDYFIKVTGRHIIDNISQIIRNINMKDVYFSPASYKPGNSMVSTVLFSMKRDYYLEYFRSVHENVDDPHGFYYEHAMFRQLKTIHQKIRFLFPPVRITLTSSGSTGQKVKTRKVSWFLRYIVSYWKNKY